MPQAQIQIDQAALPPGTPGVAREDVATGTPVTLTAVNGPFLAYRWSIVSKPIDPVAGTTSAAGLTAATASVTQLTPVDLRQTYLVELLVDSGYGLGATEEDVARITFYAGPALAVDARRRPRRRPAFGERLEHNAPDVFQPGGNTEGWGREMARIDAQLEDMWFTKGWAGGVTFTIPGAPPAAVVVRSYRVQDVQWNAGTSMYDVTFTEAMPDGNYAVFVSPEGSSGWVSHMVDNKGLGGCSIRFTDVTAPGASVIADFSFRVELGADPY